ncbi:ABC transporter ATP-binding protein [Cognatishimia sp. D5M38]|jgi:branched-chain amino acid transport system ATP-binding protein|uniref:ABC transporter ATP-binding protein n=1 Tax=Cognatishimia coralii TaxID=3083254 RepID=A0ABU8QLC2_9RHOB|nr:ABC transporter ATP-binding protein [Sulfitobacter sp. PR48]MDD9722842.1 ABC transporter ATP-binding protein [Sulfitobacter sp. PR48]
MSAFLEVEALAKNFGGVQAVKDVSFCVEKGSICSVIGPNGAGKTTVFNMISGLLRPNSGHVRLEGQALTGVPAHRMARMGLGRTFQNLAVFGHASVVDNILIGMHSKLRSGPFSAAIYWGRTRREEVAAREHVEKIIDFLEIQGVRDLPVGTLSYGVQKRVELARALASEPKLLLLDEMVSGMNQEETEDIARFILDIREELGTTVVMVEHDLGIVTDISDKLVVLDFGRKIADGQPHDVISDPTVIAAYMGAEQGAAA